jgi:hypothetical protein
MLIVGAVVDVVCIQLSTQFEWWPNGEKEGRTSVAADEGSSMPEVGPRVKRQTIEYGCKKAKIGVESQTVIQ